MPFWAITAVGRDVRASDGVERLDASGMALIPGLINAHFHSGENFNPGLYENLPLDLWFVRSHQVTRTEPLSSDGIYARTLLGEALATARAVHDSEIANESLWHLRRIDAKQGGCEVARRLGEEDVPDVVGALADGDAMGLAPRVGGVEKAELHRRGALAEQREVHAGPGPAGPQRIRLTRASAARP